MLVHMANMCSTWVSGVSIDRIQKVSRSLADFTPVETSAISFHGPFSEIFHVDGKDFE